MVLFHFVLNIVLGILKSKQLLHLSFKVCCGSIWQHTGSEANAVIGCEGIGRDVKQVN